MSLTTFRRNKTYYVRGEFRGVAVYRSAKTRNKSTAEAVLARIEEEIVASAILPDGTRRLHAATGFSAGADDYLAHGKRAPHRPRTIAFVQRLKLHFGDDRLDAIDQTAVDKAVDAIVGNEASPATKIRAVIGPLIAVLRHNAARKRCERPEFEKPYVLRRATPYLNPPEAAALIAAAAPHLQPLLIFLVGTGARLSEALYLPWANVDLDAANARFMTKNGHERLAALPPAAVQALKALPYRDGAVFRTAEGVPYADTKRAYGGQIKTGWASACRRANLLQQALTPDGEPAVDEQGEAILIARFSPHALRHTWATWFFALSRNLLLLKDEGGWRTDAMVTRYAKLMHSAYEPEIADVWGGTHPRIEVEAGARDVQRRQKLRKKA
jgi:integrase